MKTQYKKSSIEHNYRTSAKKGQGTVLCVGVLRRARACSCRKIANGRSKPLPYKQKHATPIFSPSSKHKGTELLCRQNENTGENTGDSYMC